MSQNIFATIDPDISGTQLATLLNDFKDAMVSGMSGTTRPTELDPGGYWVNTSDDPNTWSLMLYTGVDDVEVAVIDLVNETASVSLAVDSFIVKKVSDDTVGPILELVKRRIATNGQVLSGDVVGEIRAVGRDDVAGNPVVAKMIFTAAENQTASAFGGTLSFWSTPAGTAALVEHMRFIGGMVETLVPHKTNSAVLVGQNVSTAATISQLSAEKILVELTGSTTTEIEGINSGHSSKVVTIHNRSTAVVTLKHQDTGAVAADRMQFPESRDIEMLPQDSVTLYYCTADTRWKIQHASARFSGFTNDTFYANVGEYVAPTTVSKARIVAHSKKSVFPVNTNRGQASRIIDVAKAIYAWGQNTNGQIGDGTVTPRSSPVAVLGGLKFIQLDLNSTGLVSNHNIGLTENGDAYGWGLNAFGMLGDGTIIPKSSPVAVLGGLKFRSIVCGLFHTLGLAPDGTPYAWGANVVGELGLGDVIHRSSPVAVVGGLKFKKMFATTGGVDSHSFGLAFDGTLYAWGGNTIGELGVGDTVSRSSPVAVVGGLKFRDVFSLDRSVFAIAENGDLYAWGQNAVGELGVGDQVARSSPTAVLGGLKFKEVAVSQYTGFSSGNIVGLTESNILYSWGKNDLGQVGDGTVLDRSSPVAVLNGTGFIKPLVLDKSSFGLKEDGSLYAWGDNSGGQLGLNDAVPRSSPVAVVGGLSFQDVSLVSSAFGAAVLGLTWDGKLYSWGWNVTGELGLGDAVNRSSPVIVPGSLQLRTQDDSTNMFDIPIVGGNTYAIKMGAGPCFFGNVPIGNDITKVEVSYVD